MSDKRQRLTALAAAIDAATAALDRAKAELHAIEDRNRHIMLGGKGCSEMAIDVRGITNELHVLRHHVNTELERGTANAE